MLLLPLLWLRVLVLPLWPLLLWLRLPLLLTAELLLRLLRLPSLLLLLWYRTTHTSTTSQIPSSIKVPRHLRHAHTRW